VFHNLLSLCAFLAYNTHSKNVWKSNGDSYCNQIITVNIQNNKHLFHTLFNSTDAIDILVCTICGRFRFTLCILLQLKTIQVFLKCTYKKKVSKKFGGIVKGSAIVFFNEMKLTFSTPICATGTLFCYLGI
jgi:hypothetical protein